MGSAQRFLLSFAVLAGGLVACGGDKNLSLKPAMDGYKLHMQDVATAINKGKLDRAAKYTGAFRNFMADKRHQGWLKVMEEDARTPYHRIAKRLQLLEEAAVGGDAAETRQAYGVVRRECMNCHNINMLGERREAIEATVPLLMEQE